MDVGVRVATKKINAQIIEDYFEVPLSYADLEKKYGRDPSTLKKLVSSYKAAYRNEHGTDRARNGAPKDPRVLQDKRALSFRHAYIGNQVDRYMIANKLTPTAMGNQIGQSRVVVGYMTAGAHDFSLTEIERIAEVVGVSYDKLLNWKPDDHLHLAAG